MDEVTAILKSVFFNNRIDLQEEGKSDEHKLGSKKVGICRRGNGNIILNMFGHLSFR